MSTVHNEKPLPPASCENTTLFRHVLVLPKIAHSYPSRSSIGQSIPMSALRLASIGIKGATRIVIHLLVDGKNIEVMIETP
jgi:hypothetical protein